MPATEVNMGKLLTTKQAKDVFARFETRYYQVHRNRLENITNYALQSVAGPNGFAKLKKEDYTPELYKKAATRLREIAALMEEGEGNFLKNKRYAFKYKAMLSVVKNAADKKKILKNMKESILNMRSLW